MAELPDFDDARDMIENADQLFSVQFSALNNSNVDGQAILARQGDDLQVMIGANNLTPNQTHLQHIHGNFQDDGETPADSVTPTLADDADQDGFIEVAEGRDAYGQILLPLRDLDDDAAPMANADGRVGFFESYNLNDDSLFFDPLSGDEFEGGDVTPLTLREIVLHGQDVPEGFGEGTEGEVTGDGGFIPPLPVAAGEIVQIDEERALDELDEVILADDDDDDDDDDDAADGDDGGTGQRVVFQGNSGDDVFEGTDNDDVVFGAAGNDDLSGDVGADTIRGGEGDDSIDGGAGDDRLVGWRGADDVNGGDGDDVLLGVFDGDRLNGGDGDDRLIGGGGRDTFAFSGDEYGSDRVVDYNPFVERLDFSETDVDGIDDLEISSVAGSTVITEGDNRIVLFDVNSENISESDFIFSDDDDDEDDGLIGDPIFGNDDDDDDDVTDDDSSDDDDGLVGDPIFEDDDEDDGVVDDSDDDTDIVDDSDEPFEEDDSPIAATAFADDFMF